MPQDIDWAWTGLGIENDEHYCQEHGKEEYLTIDPFQKEIYDIEDEMWLCEDCLQTRHDDI